MNTKLELLGYDEKDIVKEETIEIVIKKLGVNIHYKNLVPLSIFEKYIVKVIEKAESEKITLTKTEHDEVIVDVDKIANILLLDKEIIECNVNTLATSNIIELQNERLIVHWNENLKNWERVVYDAKEKEINFLEADVEKFLKSDKNFQTKVINEKFASENRIIHNFEILSVEDECLEMKIIIVFDRDDNQLKTIIEKDERIFTLSDEVKKGVSLKTFSEEKIEDIEKIYFSEEQLDAINATDKYILLKARAGSGKTAVIVQRVKRLIKEGIHPDEILLLAFNRDAAAEMNKRIGNSFDNAMTFHSFANSLINTDEEVLEGRNLLKFVQNIVIENIAKFVSCENFIKKIENEIIDKRNDKSKDFLNITKKIESYIAYSKQQMLTSSILECKINNYKENKDYYCFLTFANEIFKKYEEKKKEEGKIDHNDQLILSIESMEQEDISELKHVMIDEFQDFSPLFYEIIKKIKEFNPDINIFAVGDNWQAINGFAGSNLKYFEEFKKYFPQANNKVMLNNYRSPEKIVGFSNRILSGDKAQALEKGGEVNFEKQLTIELIEDIKTEHPEKNIAILVRNNFEKEEFKDIDGVIVITAHKSKGLQYDIVIIADASKFGYIHPDNSLFKIFEKKEDEFFHEERRLFYVAATRAKEKLYICGEYEILLDSYKISI